MLTSIQLQNLAKDLLVETVSPFIIVLIILGPMFVIALLLLRRKKQYLALADEPFTELPLRPAGESLRLKIEELSLELDSQLFALVLIGATSVALYPRLTHGALPTVGFIATVLFGYIYFARRIFKFAREIWKYRLAYTGERVVGEELNQLLSAGFRVFHDIPFENFNIDHVIVGTPGVYAVETKTRRKPSDIKGLGRATVVFDGNALHFPKWSDTRPLEQARRNAQTLAEWLTKATGERVTASGIVTLPGWFVDRRARADVNVLHPEEIKRSFPTRPSQPLTSEQINRIAHQLTERCRLPKKSK